MGCDLLKDELQNLQLEYRNILEHTSISIFQGDSDVVIEEINIFWHRNKKLVQNVLRYLFEPYSAYVFTAATILDIDDCEHYPFISLGKYHIWDDPIYTYAKICGKSKNDDFRNKMHQQILSTINDNIKILDQAVDIIYVLPIRFLSNVDADTVHKASVKAFLSMFDENLDMKHYENNFKTISDIKNRLSPGAEKSIVFSEHDDSSLDFETRFRNYKEAIVLPLNDDATEAEIFFFSIYSYYVQAFNVLLFCEEFQLVPYIRFEVAFKYFIKLSENFYDNTELQDKVFKCVIAFFLHHTLDKEKFSKIGFREYHKMIQKYNFSDKLFNELNEEKISYYEFSAEKARRIIKRNFELMVDEYTSAGGDI